jgi:hypothetical protein
MKSFLGYHSEWNLGSPGGWDYQRITQIIGKSVWNMLRKHFPPEFKPDFDHQLLHPVNAFVEMLKEAHFIKEGTKRGLIVVMAEKETLEDVIENRNLVSHLNAIRGLKSVLIAPHELEISDDRVCYRKEPVSVIFMDFNTNVLLDLHHKYKLDPVLRAVREGRVINPRGTEPINSKGLFEVLTQPARSGYFHKETVQRTPWTRQFFPRSTSGPAGQQIPDLVEWTRKNWDHLVLKPERGYSGKGVKVGGIHNNTDEIIDMALADGAYIVQEKIPLELWSEKIPEPDHENHTVNESVRQTDFRCLFGMNNLFGFLGRYGGVPTNVGSGGGVQPLAVIPASLDVRQATDLINKTILALGYREASEILAYQDQLAMKHRLTYLLGPIRLALRPRLINIRQINALKKYCSGIWADCLTLEKMWEKGSLGIRIVIDEKEMEIIKSQRWRGSPAIFASDGLFSFGAHLSI